MAKIINSAGLVCDIVGAVLLWLYGLSEQIDRTGATTFATEDVDTEAPARAKRYDKYARLGLALLVIGFVLQLISNFL